MKSIKMASDEIRERKQLVSAIEAANTYFLEQVQKQVNTALTLRNWIISLPRDFADSVRKITFNR